MKRFGTSRATYKAERVFDYSYLFFEFFRDIDLHAILKRIVFSLLSLLGYSVNGLAYWIMPCTSLRLFGRNSIAMQYSWGTSKGNSMPESMACL